MGRCTNENAPAKALSHLENASYPDSIRELRSRIAKFKTCQTKNMGVLTEIAKFNGHQFSRYTAYLATSGKGLIHKSLITESLCKSTLLSARDCIWSESKRLLPDCNTGAKKIGSEDDHSRPR